MKNENESIRETGMNQYNGMESSPIMIGDALPEMTVQTTHGKMDMPLDYKGKWFVLFSHPGDFTPVCTTEFVSFEKKKNEFGKLGTELVGLSIDQVYSHMKWVDWIKENMKVEISFPIIADGLGLYAQKLNMLHPRKGTNTVRSVFIVDSKGIVRAMLHYPQEVGRNIDEILRLVKALQVSDKEEVAVPANWPVNELINSDVIIPPPQSEEEKYARSEDEGITCKDWWFCHKKSGY